MATTAIAKKLDSKPKTTYFSRLIKNIVAHKYAYLMIVPVLAYYIVFCYAPMYGAVIAFKDFSPRLGILKSEWVGFRYFGELLTSASFYRALKNTLVISVSSLVFCFPAPILLALLLNELRGKWFPRIVQTTSYLPHFISMVVVCGMIKDFTMDTGFVNDIIAAFGGTRSTLLNKAGAFVPIYIISDIWQGAGWGSIIYLAALTSIDQQLYEAADIDGAGRMRKLWAITLPGIMPTITMMLILKMGSMLSVGYEKIILLYNQLTYESADVISSFVYRRGLQDMDWSFSTAVGLFNSVINFVLLFSANTISRKVSGGGLW